MCLVSTAILTAQAKEQYQQSSDGKMLDHTLGKQLLHHTLVEQLLDHTLAEQFELKKKYSELEEEYQLLKVSMSQR